MINVIEQHMQAEFQNSVNKIIEGTKLKWMGVSNQSSQVQKGKKQGLSRRGTQKNMDTSEPVDGDFAAVRVSQFIDDDHVQNLRKPSNLSFNIQPRPIVGSAHGGDHEQ